MMEPLGSVVLALNKVRDQGIPLVFLDRIPAGEQVKSVVLNDHERALQTKRHLLEQGCRRVAHLAGPHFNIYRHRRQGYLDALTAFGIAADEALVDYSNMTTESEAWTICHLLALPNPGGGVFGAGDSAILGSLQVLKH